MEVVNRLLSRKKVFERNFKIFCKKFTYYSFIAIITVVTLAAGGIDGFQCSDLGIAASAIASGAMMGAVIKATIKQNKQEKIELEDENNKEPSILQRELEELELENSKIKHSYKTIRKK